MLGDGMQAPLPLAALMAEVTAKWDTYYILPAGASYAGDAQVLGFWRDLLGQNVLELADLDAVCETIALTVGLGEDAISLDDGLADLGDVGSAAGPAVSKALAVIGAGRAALDVAAAPDDRVRTHLSRFVLVDPLAMAAEAAHLASVGVPDALDRLTVDRDALLATPYHRAANRARELARGRDRHGSCGMGIGETVRYALEHPADAPRVADCAAPRTLAGSLGRLRDRLTDELGPLGGPGVADLCDAYRAFAERVPLVDAAYLDGLLRAGPAVFEGAQGVLLDEWRGFHPYTTWSTTTFANAETLLAEAGQTAVRLGVVRPYLTRHGPGPFVTEDSTREFPEPHNRYGAWQGAARLSPRPALSASDLDGEVLAEAFSHWRAGVTYPLPDSSGAPGAADGRAGGTGGHLADQLADPAHAVDSRLGWSPNSWAIWAAQPRTPNCRTVSRTASTTVSLVGASDRCSPDANSAVQRASIMFNLDIASPSAFPWDGLLHGRASGRGDSPGDAGNSGGFAGAGRASPLG